MIKKSLTWTLYFLLWNCHHFFNKNYKVYCSLSYSQASGEKPETMSHKDAAMFPIIASAALFGLYIFFQVRAKMMLYKYCICIRIVWRSLA